MAKPIFFIYDFLILAAQEVRCFKQPLAYGVQFTFFWAITIVINPAIGLRNISIGISLSSRQELFCNYAHILVK